MKHPLGRAAFLFLGLTFLLTYAEIAHAVPKKKGPVISRITIRGTDIFDLESNVSLKRFPYREINFLHIKTKEQVVRNELLFQVGELYDPFLISETERNLRALSFIRAARIAKFPQRDGTVALVVHVNDSWTTEPQINLGGVNKVDTTEIGFKEKNLFGYGKTVGLFYKKGDNFTQREYSYTDPRFLSSRWQLKGKLQDRSDGELKNLSLERPYFSADTRFSARASYDHQINTIDEYENNIRTSRYEQKKETSEAAVGTKVGGGRDFVNHAGLRYKITNIDYSTTHESPPGFNVPIGEDTRTVYLDLDTGHNHFIEAEHLEKMIRVEDLNRGPFFRISPGYTPSSINEGQKSSEEIDTKLEMILQPNADHMVKTNFSHSGRKIFDEKENQLYKVELKYYYLPNAFHTLVINTRAEWGDDLDPDSQIKLGGDNGLRAFKDDSIVGTKGWLFNIEDRMFLTDEIANLFALGAVVFYDTGYVWDENDAVAISDLKSDIGTGLRIALTRSSNEVILRFDVSYRLQRLQSDDSKIVFTFGTDQAF